MPRPDLLAVLRPLSARRWPISAHRRRAHGGGPAALVLASALALGWAMPARALQLVDAEDGVAVEAIVSTREVTRIRIEGAAITDVVGSVQASGCGQTPAATASASAERVAPATVSIGAAPAASAEALLECDLDKGEIYLRPLGDSRKPLNLFVSSAHATYTLVLRRADTPADTIVIRDRGRSAAFAGSTASTARWAAAPGPVAPRLVARSASADARDGPDGTLDAASGEASDAAPGALPRGAATAHVRAIKTLLVAMATHRVPADMRVDELLQPMQLWTDSALTLVRRFEGRGLVGELFVLQNLGSGPLVVTESEFDRPDDAPSGEPAPGRVAPMPAMQRASRTPSSGPVLGIAVAQHRLLPGQQTAVYVIREARRP